MAPSTARHEHCHRRIELLLAKPGGHVVFHLVEAVRPARPLLEYLNQGVGILPAQDSGHLAGLDRPDPAEKLRRDDLGGNPAEVAAGCLRHVVGDFARDRGELLAGKHAPLGFLDARARLPLLLLVEAGRGVDEDHPQAKLLGMEDLILGNLVVGARLVLGHGHGRGNDGVDIALRQHAASRQLFEVVVGRPELLQLVGERGLAAELGLQRHDALLPFLVTQREAGLAGSLGEQDVGDEQILGRPGHGGLVAREGRRVVRDLVPRDGELTRRGLDTVDLEDDVGERGRGQGKGSRGDRREFGSSPWEPPILGSRSQPRQTSCRSPARRRFYPAARSSAALEPRGLRGGHPVFLRSYSARNPG